MSDWQIGKNRIFTKVISLLMAHIFLLTNIGFAAPSDRSLFKNKRPNYKAIQQERESGLQQKKDVLSGKTQDKKSPYKKDSSHILDIASLKDLSSIYIPDSLGRVVEVYQAPPGESRLIVHIQDLHTNPEGQLNLASILELLIKNYNLGLVCSEGAEGEVDTSSVSSFPDYDVREKTARVFIDSGELTGEEYLSITKYPELPIWGIEDKDIYFKNIIEFNKIMRYSQDAMVFISQVKEVLEKLKPRVYSSKLLEIGAKETEYEEGILDTNEYLDYLLEIDRGVAAELAMPELQDGSASFTAARFKNIAILQETLEFEKNIDQQKTKEESQKLLLELQNALQEKQNKSEINALLTKASLFKDQKISPFSFYSYLDELARRHLKGEIDKYPNLFSLVIYLEKLNSLDSIKLFQEIEELGYEVKDALSTNDNQKLLTKSIRHITLLEGLFNLKISNEELDYYLANKEDFRVNFFEKFLKENLQKYNIDSFVDFNPDLIDMNLSELEYFYEIAHKRDIAMINNTLAEIEKRDANVSALIAGGFHTRGFTKLLKQYGYSYIVISPYSSTDIDEENYRYLLSGKRRPLSELIDQLNEKLRPVMSFVNKEFKADSNYFRKRGIEEGWLEAGDVALIDVNQPNDRFMAMEAALGLLMRLELGLELDEQNMSHMFIGGFRKKIREGEAIEIKKIGGQWYISYGKVRLTIKDSMIGVVNKVPEGITEMAFSVSSWGQNQISLGSELGKHMKAEEELKISRHSLNASLEGVVRAEREALTDPGFIESLSRSPFVRRYVLPALIAMQLGIAAPGIAETNPVGEVDTLAAGEVVDEASIHANLEDPESFAIYISQLHESGDFDVLGNVAGILEGRIRDTSGIKQWSSSCRMIMELYYELEYGVAIQDTEAEARWNEAVLGAINRAIPILAEHFENQELDEGIREESIRTLKEIMDETSLKETVQDMIVELIPAFKDAIETEKPDAALWQISYHFLTDNLNARSADDFIVAKVTAFVDLLPLLKEKFVESVSRGDCSYEVEKIWTNFLFSSNRLAKESNSEEIREITRGVFTSLKPTLNWITNDDVSISMPALALVSLDMLEYIEDVERIEGVTDAVTMYPDASIPFYPGEDYFTKIYDIMGIKVLIINDVSEWEEIIERYDHPGAGGFHAISQDSLSGENILYIKGVGKSDIFLKEAMAHETVHLLHMRFYGLGNVKADFADLKRSFVEQSEDKESAEKIISAIESQFRDEYTKRGMPVEFAASEFYAWYYGLFTTGKLGKIDTSSSEERKAIETLFRDFDRLLSPTTKALLIEHYKKLSLPVSSESQEPLQAKQDETLHATWAYVKELSPENYDEADMFMPDGKIVDVSLVSLLRAKAKDITAGQVVELEGYEFEVVEINGQTILVSTDIIDVLSDGEKLALLSNALSETGFTKTKDGLPLIISSLSKSPRLFEDCQQNGFIGINQAFLDLYSEHKLDEEKRSYLMALLQVGIEHELYHELGQTDESDIKKTDAVRFVSLCKAENLNISTAVRFLKEDTGIIGDDFKDLIGLSEFTRIIFNAVRIDTKNLRKPSRLCGWIAHYNYRETHNPYEILKIILKEIGQLQYMDSYAEALAIKIEKARQLFLSEDFADIEKLLSAEDWEVIPTIGLKEVVESLKPRSAAQDMGDLGLISFISDDAISYPDSARESEDFMKASGMISKWVDEDRMIGGNEFVLPLIIEGTELSFDGTAVSITRNGYEFIIRAFKDRVIVEYESESKEERDEAFKGFLRGSDMDWYYSGILELEKESYRFNLENDTIILTPLHEILKLHRIISRNVMAYTVMNTKKAKRGLFRSQKAGRDFITYVSSMREIARLMDRYFDWLRDEEIKIEKKDKNALHPVEFAVRAFYILRNIHPFENANTRTASLVMNYILMRHGYSPFILTKSNEKDFSDIIRFMDVPTQESVSISREGKAVSGEIVSTERLFNFYPAELMAFIAPRTGNIVDSHDFIGVVQGEYGFTSADSVSPFIKTCWASACTILTLYDKYRKIGMVAHIDGKTDLKTSIYNMISDFASLGIEPVALEATIVTRALESNIELADRVYGFLRDYKIEEGKIRKDYSGIDDRAVVLDTRTGAVYNLTDSIEKGVSFDDAMKRRDSLLLPSTLRVLKRYYNREFLNKDVYGKLDALLVYLEDVKDAFNHDTVLVLFEQLDRVLKDVSSLDLDSFNFIIKDFSPRNRMRMAFNMNKLKKEGVIFSNVEQFFTMPGFYENDILASLDIIPYMRTYNMSMEEIKYLDFGEFELAEGLEEDGAYAFIFRKGENEYEIKITEGFDIELIRINSFKKERPELTSMKEIPARLKSLRGLLVAQ